MFGYNMQADYLEINKLWYVPLENLSSNVFAAIYILLRISYRCVEAYDIIEHAGEHRKFGRWQKDWRKGNTDIRK